MNHPASERAGDDGDGHPPILIIRLRPRIPGGDIEVLHRDARGQERLILRLGLDAGQDHGSPGMEPVLIGSIRAGVVNMIVDMTHTQWLNSRGIALLLSWFSVVKRHQGQLVLACLQPRIVNIFATTELDRVFYVCPSLQAAATLLAAE